MGARDRAIVQYYARFVEASGNAAEAKARDDFGTWVHQNRRAEEAERRLRGLGAEPAEMPPLVSLPPLVVDW